MSGTGASATPVSNISDWLTASKGGQDSSESPCFGWQNRLAGGKSVSHPLDKFEKINIYQQVHTGDHGSQHITTRCQTKLCWAPIPWLHFYQPHETIAFACRRHKTMSAKPIIPLFFPPNGCWNLLRHKFALRHLSSCGFHNTIVH